MEESGNRQGAHQEQVGGVGMGREAESECERHKRSAGECVGGVRHVQVNVRLQRTPKSSHKRTSIWMLATPKGHQSHTVPIPVPEELFHPLFVFLPQHQPSGSQRSQSESGRNRGKEQEENNEKLTKVPFWASGF